MTEHKCNECNKLYSSKQSLCNHNRKYHKTIIPIKIPTNILIISSYNEDKIKCTHCKKKFSSYKNKWRHENKYCKNKENGNNLNDKINIVATDNITPTIVPNNTTTNSNNKIINSNNNIIINNYMNDNIEYISDAFIKKMFNHLKNEDEHHIPIQKVIENIKFNPYHKENNNIKITNMRSKVGMKYDDNKWSTVDKDQLLNDLYKLGGDMLALWAKKTEFLTDDIKVYYERFNKISKKVLKTGIKEELNKTAYIYTKNNDNILDI